MKYSFMLHKQLTDWVSYKTNQSQNPQLYFFGDFLGIQQKLN